MRDSTILRARVFQARAERVTDGPDLGRVVRLPTTGNRVDPLGLWTATSRNLDVSGTFSAWQEVNDDGDNVIGKDGTSIWVSVLWKANIYGRGWTLGLRDDNFVRYEGDRYSDGKISRFDLGLTARF